MSRAAILARIQKNKPEQVFLPDLKVFRHEISEADLIADFIKNSTVNMSNVVNIIDSKLPIETYLKEFIASNFKDVKQVYNTMDVDQTASQIDFRVNIDIFIAEAKLGVAENACVWLDDSVVNQRLSPFACEHNLLIVNHKNIVPTMHQAYQALNINQTGYGLFIAGPSKTADIEQSLVVGAQGAVSNTIILI